MDEIEQENTNYKQSSFEMRNANAFDELDSNRSKRRSKKQKGKKNEDNNNSPTNNIATPELQIKESSKKLKLY